MSNYDYFTDMYQDSYFPDFLVDKIKEILKGVVASLENDETDITAIQASLYSVKHSFLLYNLSQ
ncbi:DUF5713 family protein [Enterococcus sp. LJL128]